MSLPTILCTILLATITALLGSLSIFCEIMFVSTIQEFCLFSRKLCERVLLKNVCAIDHQQLTTVRWWSNSWPPTPDHSNMMIIADDNSWPPTRDHSNMMIIADDDNSWPPTPDHSKMIAENGCWEWLLKVAAETGCWEDLLRMAAEKSCWEELLRAAAENGCWEELLRMAAEKSCWEWLQRMGAEKRCWKELLKRAAESRCWEWLQRMAAEKSCWKELLKRAAVKVWGNINHRETLRHDATVRLMLCIKKSPPNFGRMVLFANSNLPCENGTHAKLRKQSSKPISSWTCSWQQNPHDCSDQSSEHLIFWALTRWIHWSRSAKLPSGLHTKKPTSIVLLQLTLKFAKPVKRSHWSNMTHPFEECTNRLEINSQPRHRRNRSVWNFFLCTCRTRSRLRRSSKRFVFDRLFPHVGE